MDEITYIGYHGTTNENAKNIIALNEFNKSNNADDWLGSGVYFYETLDNALLYNIKKYKKHHKKVPQYKQLINEYSIIKCCIKCKKNEIIDFSEIDQIYKFLWAWLQIFERVKDDEEYKKLKFKDGYIINWLINNTPYFENCKVLLNIFCLDLTSYGKVKEIFSKKTRIGGYRFHQLYICVVDINCITDIKCVKKMYQNRYTAIDKLLKIY